MSISSFHALLALGKISILDITRIHLNRIRSLNPLLNCITFLSSNALSIALSLDVQLQSGAKTTATHPLLGVPVLLKDNFDIAGSPTTAGCLALRSNIATIDGPVVTSLRNAGAVILGRTNMHELALEGLSVSSLAGQTRNPYDLSRTPGGSSGGSGAAVAAGMCMLATGTDTVNSLRSPASACGVVGFRSTTGLVSTRGVQPVSWTQDVVGMIGRSVADVASALDVIKKPSHTPNGPPSRRMIPHKSSSVRIDTKSMSAVGPNGTGTLIGKRIGLLEELMPKTAASIISWDSETAPVLDAMHQTVSALRDAGADVILITDPVYSSDRILHELDTQRHEFCSAMNEYLMRQSASNIGPRTLEELYSPGGDFLVIPSQYDYITSALSPSYGPRSYAYREKLSLIACLKAHLRHTFAAHKLDAALYPQQKNLVVPIGSPSQNGRNGILAAVTGYPSVCLPTVSAARVPIGMELMGLPWSDESLLQLARSVEDVVLEKRGGQRRVPQMMEEADLAEACSATSNGRASDEKDLDAEMEHYIKDIVPDKQSIHPAYPVGHLR